MTMRNLHEPYGQEFKYVEANLGIGLATYHFIPCAFNDLQGFIHIAIHSTDIRSIDSRDYKKKSCR